MLPCLLFTLWSAVNARQRIKEGHDFRGEASLSHPSVTQLADGAERSGIPLLFTET
jgi:hypothetical protein